MCTRVVAVLGVFVALANSWSGGTPTAMAAPSHPSGTATTDVNSGICDTCLPYAAKILNQTKGIHSEAQMEEALHALCHRAFPASKKDDETSLFA